MTFFRITALDGYSKTLDEALALGFCLECDEWFRWLDPFFLDREDLWLKAFWETLDLLADFFLWEVLEEAMSKAFDSLILLNFFTDYFSDIYSSGNYYDLEWTILN